MNLANNHAPGRARRAVVAVAQALALGAVFTAATVGAVAVHLDMPAPRRFATARVNALLADAFQGKIAIHHVGYLHLTTLGGIEAEVFDPEGHRVLHVHGARIRVKTSALLRSLVRGGPLDVPVNEVTVDGAEVVIDDATGEIGLVRAFDPKVVSTTPSPGVRVTIPAIHIHHAWVHGQLAAVPVIDADLKNLEGAFAFTPETTDLEVKHLYVQGRGLPGLNPEGDVRGSASLPAQTNDRRHIEAHYEGRLGEVPVRAEGSLQGKDVNAILDVTDASPEAIGALASGRIALGAPVSAHAEVHGSLPELRPTLSATIGAGEITASGRVTLPDETRPDLVAAVKIGVKDLDASLLHGEAPTSRITADLEADIVSPPGGDIGGSILLTNHTGELKGQALPAFRVRGEGSLHSSIKATAVIDERGLPTRVDATLSSRPGGTALDQLAVAVDAAIPDLRRVERLGPIGRGQAHAKASGHLDLESTHFSAKAHADVAGLDVSDVRLGRGQVDATATGTLDAVRFSASVRGADLSAFGYTFPRLLVRAAGSPATIDVSAELDGDAKAPSARAAARIINDASLALQRTHVRLERQDVSATVDIASLGVRGGDIDVRGLMARGLGRPLTASARISPSSVVVRAASEDIDLARVATLLAREEDARGHVALDVAADVRRRSARGHARVSIDDLSVRGVEGASVRVATSVEGKHLTGDVSASLGARGHLDIHATDVTLGGEATRADAWIRATGALAISGALDLDRIMSDLPIGRRPFERAQGRISIEGKATRPSAREAPSLDLEAETRGLVLTGKQEKTRLPDGSISLGPPPFHTEGLDGKAAVHLAAATGRTQVNLDVHDARGSLVSIAAGATLPIDRILRDTGNALLLARKTPLEATVTVPRRSLEALPPALGRLPVRGDIEAIGELRGTVDAPALRLSAKGVGLTPRDAATTACAAPMNVETNLVYDGEKVNLELHASMEGRDVLAAESTVKVRAADALAGGNVPWDASAQLALTGFPLDKVGALARKPLGGLVSGKVAVADLHRAASLTASLEARDLSLDQTRFPHGNVTVTMKDGAFTAAARLEQTDGFADASVKGSIAWGAALAPALDSQKPVDLTLRAQAFRADAVSPFTQGLFSEIDGRVDADAKLHVEPGGKDGHTDGAIAVREGVLEAPQLGERFHGVRGRIVMKPWGTLRFEDFAAEAPTGKLVASGDAVLDGLSLQRANAKIHIANGDSIPIAVEGVPMGRAYGDISARAVMSPDQKRLDVHLDIPRLHVDLPQSTGNSVQPLEPDGKIRVGVVSGRDFVSLPLAAPSEPRAPSALVIRAAVRLGDDVVVRRDTTINIAAEGEPIIEVGTQTRMSGRIRVTRGRLELQGKQFTIDRGEVSFVGDDPADPIVFATASWDAPDGTRVYADFSGHVSTGKLALRSEPALAQEEILALLLFGSTSGSLGSEPPPGRAESAGVKAAGMAGGVVTQGLNKALSGITAADISTRVDTSDAQSPRPELSVQISRRVSARIGYKLGVPAPGDNPDRTELTLDWRFVRDVSLTAVVGDQGSTALDLLWRRRY
ncbi:Hypothetical protein A7982_11909 [Minicystis rosea]|nr:Hypothetical protein A7982_11909 [Minicystis rosea]